MKHLLLLLLFAACFANPADARAQLLRGYHTLYSGESFIAAYKPPDAAPIRCVYLQKINAADGALCRISVYDAEYRSLFAADTAFLLQIDEAQKLQPTWQTTTHTFWGAPFYRPEATLTEPALTPEEMDKIAAAQSVTLIFKRGDAVWRTLKLPKKILREWKKVLAWRRQNDASA